jgi:signal transduction histidine kinase/ActR/RegA family two-component response regulator
MPTNRDPLRVLHLEADDGDHERVRRAALKAGLNPAFERAKSLPELEAALRRGGLDLVLADLDAPGCGGATGLGAALAAHPGVPCIVVSGSVGEEAVADCLRMGAVDFVHKERLGRLPAAVARALGAAAPRAPGNERREGRGADSLHAQKVEFVGKLAGGVAHDFNNLLTIITGYVSMLLDREDLPPASAEVLKRVFTASRQATGLVHQLLLFSRKRAFRREVIDLNAEVEAIVDMLRRLLGEAIAVDFEPSPDSPRVHADVGMLEQVLMNLAINARDAMPRGGRLAVRVGLRPGDGTGAPAGSPARPGAFACISVRDTGCGIPAEAQPRVFEPFFSTKGDSRGAGLGLATAQDIVMRHDGWIDFETAVGSGTVFRVYLPLTNASPAAGSPGAGGTTKGAKGLVLLVEDEAAVREFTAAVLQQDGYAVLQARSGESALEAWRWHAARIDLLVSDVVLPGDLSGPLLAARLQAEKPSLRAILATGYGKDAVVQQMAQASTLAVLSKPYTPKSLLRAVGDAMAPRTGPGTSA